MERTVRRTRIPLTVEAPHRARRWVKHAVPLEPHVGEVVVLLLSELVANSVRHSGRSAGDQVTIFVRKTTSSIHVEVCDPGPGGNIRPDASSDHSGLRILDSLSDRWGVTQDPTTVWFDVAG